MKKEKWNYAKKDRTGRSKKGKGNEVTDLLKSIFFFFFSFTFMSWHFHPLFSHCRMLDYEFPPITTTHCTVKNQDRHIHILDLLCLYCTYCTSMKVIFHIFYLVFTEGVQSLCGPR